ncbi:hypothetical protein GCM10027048_39590 [Hymenobacter coalescens]
MVKKGKFVLFESAFEFADWLEQQRVVRTIHHVQNHHTWRPAYADFNGRNHFALLQGMERSHVQDRGFSQIAQNLTTFPDGQLALGRPLDVKPAGIYAHNTGGICLEHVGDFDAGRDPMTDAHRDVIVQLNAVLCHHFGLRPSVHTVVYHHWFDPDTGQRLPRAEQQAVVRGVKTCPGTAFFGGNTVAAAQAHFLPLVLRAMPALV